MLVDRDSSQFPDLNLCIFVILIDASCYLWDLYRISIAFAFRSFDRSLFTHLIFRYSLA